MGKKGDFKKAAARLIQAGGGDKTNLSCSGNSTNTGSKQVYSQNNFEYFLKSNLQLLNLTNILNSCETDLNTACQPPSVNTSGNALCLNISKSFNETVTACMVKAITGSSDSCSCFQNDTTLPFQKKMLSSCKGTNWSNSTEHSVYINFQEHLMLRKLQSQGQNA